MTQSLEENFFVNFQTVGTLALSAQITVVEQQKTGKRIEVVV